MGAGSALEIGVGPIVKRDAFAELKPGTRAVIDKRR